MGNSLTSECRDPEQEKNLGRGPPPGRIFDSAASSSSTTGVVRVPTSTRDRQLSPTGTGKREQKGRDRDSQPSATDPTSPAAALWAEGRQLCAVNITSDQPEWRQNYLREAGSVRHVLIVGLDSPHTTVRVLLPTRLPRTNIAVSTYVLDRHRRLADSMLHLSDFSAAA